MVKQRRSIPWQLKVVLVVLEDPHRIASFKIGLQEFLYMRIHWKKSLQKRDIIFKPSKEEGKRASSLYRLSS